MISSTMRDLGLEREVVAAAISDFGATPRYFERFSAPGDPGQVYRPEVARATVYLFLAGERYGSPLPSDGVQRSATHLEYDTAYVAFKPVLAYNKLGVARDAGMAALVTTLEARHTVTRFQGLEDLRAAVREGLTRLAEAQSTTWVKLESTVFPVAHLELPPRTQDGYNAPSLQKMTLRASLRDAGVRAALSAPERNQPLTLAREIFEADQVQMSESRAGQYDLTQTLEITARTARVHPLSVIPVSNGESSEEQLEAALGSLLFARALPAQRAGNAYHFMWTLRPVGPQLRALYGELAAQQRDAELFVPMAELLLTDRLLRGSDSDPAPLTRLEQLEVSPVVNGRTFVRVQGTHVSAYFGPSVQIVQEGFIDFHEPLTNGITAW